MTTTKQHVTRSIASLRLPKPVPALITAARGIVTAMTNNPSFPARSPRSRRSRGRRARRERRVDIHFGAEVSSRLPTPSRVWRALDREGAQRRPEDIEAVGTRHRAAYRFIHGHPAGLAIVVSQDGGVTFVANRGGEVVYWEQTSRGLSGTTRRIRFIMKSVTSDAPATTWPRRSKCSRTPPGPSTTIKPASTEATPPESCCTDALTAMNEPRLSGDGIADMSA